MNNKKAISWSSNLRITTNTATSKVYYYIGCCDVWRRVSKDDYESREQDAIRSNCFITTIKGDLVQNSKVVYGTHYIKREV